MLPLRSSRIDKMASRYRHGASSGITLAMRLPSFLFLVIIAIGLVFANGWSKGSSAFGFESPFWDLGLVPILTALAIGA
jgi:hypothetical protein